MKNKGPELQNEITKKAKIADPTLEAKFLEAAQNGDIEAVREMLFAGVSIHAIDPLTGRNALHNAIQGAQGKLAMFTYLPLITLLVTCGADLHCRDKENNIPEDYLWYIQNNKEFYNEDGAMFINEAYAARRDFDAAFQWGKQLALIQKRIAPEMEFPPEAFLHIPVPAVVMAYQCFIKDSSVKTVDSCQQEVKSQEEIAYQDRHAP